MRRKIFAVLIIAAVVLSAAGCGNKKTGNSSSSKKTSEKETETEAPTIFDKIIAGSNVGDEKSLFDITEGLTLDGYVIKDVTAMEEGSAIMALETSETDSKLIEYDVTEGNVVNEYVIDCVLSQTAGINTTASDVPYVYDDENDIVVVYNYDEEVMDTYELEFDANSFLVSESGNRFFYTLDNDPCIYEYYTETGNSVAIYEPEEDAFEIILENVEDDDDTFMVKLYTEEFNGYAKVSAELAEMDKFDDIDGEVYLAGDEYIYSSANYANTVVIENDLTPRLTTLFAFEDDKELENLSVYKGPYFFTYVEGLDGTTIRFYNVTSGIMINRIVIPKEYTLTFSDFMSDFETECLFVNDADGNAHVMIWNYQDVSEIIS